MQAYPGAFVDLTKTINFKDFATYKTELMTSTGKSGIPLIQEAALFLR